jgi:BlaI family transcriptional regulator, penicillinase repressor
MPKQRKLPRPTASELEILQVIWSLGPSTVRDVFEHLDRERKTGYTTVLKLMQIMVEKGLLERNEEQRAHVYRAAFERGQTQSQLLDEMLDRVFGGSAAQLVMSALSHRKATPEEIAEIRKMLDEFEGEKHS